MFDIGYKCEENHVIRHYADASPEDFSEFCKLLRLTRGKVYTSVNTGDTICTMQTYDYQEKCETKINYNMTTRTMSVHWRHREFGEL